MIQRILYINIIAVFLFIQKTVAQPVFIEAIPTGSYGFFSALGNLYFFNNNELWHSNGTEAGTLLLKNVTANPVAFYSETNQREPESYVTSTRFFFVTNNSSTFTLWRSDGTAVGTTSVATYDNIKPMGVLNNEFYYGAVIDTDTTLYKISLGAPVQLRKMNLASFPIYSDTKTAVNPKDHEVVGGNIFFSSFTAPGAELWKTNGTVAGTVEIKEFIASFLFNFTNVSGTLFFSVSDMDENEFLWKSNGTTTGTTLVKSFPPNGSGDDHFLGDFVAYKGKLFFTEAFSISEDVYISDGTTAGTILLKDFGTDEFVSHAGVANDQIYFVVELQGFPEFLYRSDGTPQGTILIKNLLADGTRDFTETGNHLFYADHDGPGTSGTPDNPEDAFQLWQSDLSTINTVAVRDLFPGTTFPNSDNLTNVNEILYFTSLQSGQLNLYRYNPNAPAVAAPFFTLVDADSDRDRDLLMENDTIVKYPGDQINIRYNPSGTTPGSVRFILNGAPFSTESVAPFSLAGDNNGNYRPWTTSAQGNYTLVAREFSGSGGTGTILKNVTIHFYIKVITFNQAPVVNAGTDKTITLPASSTTLTGTASDPDGSINNVLWTFISGPLTPTIVSPNTTSTNVTGLTAAGTYLFRLTATDNNGLSASDEVEVTVNPATLLAVTSFTLINAVTDTDIMTLTNGAVLDYATLPTNSLSVRVNTSPATVGSVRIIFDAIVRTENSAPYSLFGDAGGNYTGQTFTLGSHTLSATPYSGSGASGTAGTALSINFTVVNSAARISSNTEVALMSNCFPNPTTDYFQISLEATEALTAEVKIYDLSGKLQKDLFEGNIVKGETLNFTWTPEGHQKGLYLLKIKTGDNEKTEKLVLE